MTGARLVVQRQEEQRATARHLGCNEVVFCPTRTRCWTRRSICGRLHADYPAIQARDRRLLRPGGLLLRGFFPAPGPSRLRRGGAGGRLPLRARSLFPGAARRGVGAARRREGLPRQHDRTNCWIHISTVVDKKIAAIQMHASRSATASGSRRCRLRAEDEGRPHGLTLPRHTTSSIWTQADATSGRSHP